MVSSEKVSDEEILRQNKKTERRWREEFLRGLNKDASIDLNRQDEDRKPLRVKKERTG